MSGMSRIGCDEIAGSGLRGSGFFLAPCANRSVMPLVLFLPDRLPRRKGETAYRPRDIGGVWAWGAGRPLALPAREAGTIIVAPISRDNNASYVGARGEMQRVVFQSD